MHVLGAVSAHMTHQVVVKNIAKERVHPRPGLHCWSTRSGAEVFQHIHEKACRALGQSRNHEKPSLRAAERPIAALDELGVVDAPGPGIPLDARPPNLFSHGCIPGWWKIHPADWRNRALVAMPTSAGRLRVRLAGRHQEVLTRQARCGRLLIAYRSSVWRGDTAMFQRSARVRYSIGALLLRRIRWRDGQAPWCRGHQ